MSTLELIDKKEQLEVRAEAIVKAAEKEQRKLNEDEQTEFDALTQQIKDTDSEIRQINEKLNKESNINKRTMEKFSLIKAINSVANGRALDERSQEVVNAGIAEMRKAGQSYNGQIQLPVEERATIQATVATAGEEAVAEDKLNILEPLRANLVMAAAGANVLTGLVGDVSIPVYSGSTVGWAGEVAAAADAAGTFSEVKLSPKRLTAFLDVSKQFLLQDSVGAEEMLKNDIVRALSNKLEATILGDEAGDDTKPAGIFYNAGTMAAADYKAVVGMEQVLEENNVVGDIKFIVSPAVKAELKTTAKSDKIASGFVMENGEVDGLSTLSTSACKGIVCGNFADYVIAQWGAIDLTVDPYTQAANGKVRLVINAYFDAKPRREEAFVAKTIAD